MSWFDHRPQREASEMGFLQRIRNVFRDGAPGPHSSSFLNLSEEDLEAHLQIDRYGDFLLTEAVRPSYDLQVVPQQGYRHDRYHDEESQTSVPVVMASASREILFDVFLDLLDPIGEVVDVVLETSHDHRGQDHVDLYREHIDIPVLKSILCDFEDQLLNDGCTGIAVLNAGAPLEVQFDEHKLLVVYGDNLREFERVFQDHGIECIEQMRFITEAEHVHSSSDEYRAEFDVLKSRLGMDGVYDESII